MHGSLTARDVTPAELRGAILRAYRSMQEYRSRGEPELAATRERAMNRMLDQLPAAEEESHG